MAGNTRVTFNFTKCKCLHIGYNNPNYDFFMGDVRIKSIDIEKDLGVQLHKSLKLKEQVNYVVKKANRIRGTIRRTYTDKSMKNIKNLYITLVRPIIENCQQAWCPHLQKDIDKLESVQRRATKMITGISKLPYYLRLRKCGLLSLQDKKKKADMLEVFNIINGFTYIDTKRIFELIHIPRPGRHKSIVRHHSRLDARHKFFSQRVIKPWNTLPSDCVNCTNS